MDVHPATRFHPAACGGMELATAIAAFASLLRQYFVSVNIHRIAFAEAARLAFGTTLTSKAASTASTTSRVLCPMKEDFGISVGTQRTIDGQRRVYYDGYWIKAYEVPAEKMLTAEVNMPGTTWAKTYGLYFLSRTGFVEDTAIQAAEPSEV